MNGWKIEVKAGQKWRECNLHNYNYLELKESFMKGSVKWWKTSHGSEIEESELLSYYDKE